MAIYSVDSFARHRVRTLACWFAGIALAYSISIVNAQAEDSAEGLLMRINKAASSTNFSGHFIYVREAQIDAMEVVRRVKNDIIQERLYSMSGDAREVVKDDEGRIWCYIPDKNMGVHDYRQTVNAGFPSILLNDITRLGNHYEFISGGFERIAGRIANSVKVVPKDRFRYGYHLWADAETGLLLRSDLVDPEGQVIEQYLFVSIEIGRDIADEELRPVNNKEQLVWFGADHPNLTTQVRQSHWNISNLPAGFELANHIRRMTPVKLEEEEHMVFTDGLSSVSVFIKQKPERQSSASGVSKMGAVHAYRDSMEDHMVTVMGEVPAATVVYIAENIRYHPR